MTFVGVLARDRRRHVGRLREHGGFHASDFRVNHFHAIRLRAGFVFRSQQMAVRESQ